MCSQRVLTCLNWFPHSLSRFLVLCDVWLCMAQPFAHAAGWDIPPRCAQWLAPGSGLSHHVTSVWDPHLSLHLSGCYRICMEHSKHLATCLHIMAHHMKQSQVSQVQSCLKRRLQTMIRRPSAPKGVQSERNACVLAPPAARMMWSTTQASAPAGFSCHLISMLPLAASRLVWPHFHCC